MIQLTVPSIEEDDLQAVRAALASGCLTQGVRVAAFERAVAAHVGTRYAVAVSSGTAALHLGLLALGVQSGDIVIITAYSSIATANVVELCGAQPVFVDIQPDTFNLDPMRLQETLTRLMAHADTARRVKAILPAHTFGQLADMPALLELAGSYGLPVVEDACGALGATLHERQAGAWGVMGCFSFHTRKAITTGEGGTITTNDPLLYHHLRALRNQGQDPDAAAPDFIMPGLNYRMTEFQAALGSAQMSKLERIIGARRRVAERYNTWLKNTPLQTPVVRAASQPTYQSYVTLLPEHLAARRDDLFRHLSSQGIETAIDTWDVPLTTYFRSRYSQNADDFPMTNRVFQRALSLPLHERLQEVEQGMVVRQVVTALKALGKR